MNAAHELLLTSRAPNTRRTYSTGQNAYTEFMKAHGRNPVPATADDAVVFLSWLNTKPKPNGGVLSFATVENYRWAVHALHTDYGLDSPFAKHPLVRLAMAAIRRARGPTEQSSLERLPVTRQRLRQAMSQLDLSKFDDSMLAAAMWTATAGLFRPGEVAIRMPTDRSRMLTIGSLRMIDGETAIHLAESKTDRWRTGVDVKLRSPTAAQYLAAYLQRRPKIAPHEPLFVWSTGQPLLHDQLTSYTTQLLTAAGVSFTLPDGRPCRGVSFRRGGATDLANAGVSDKAIQQFGRWKSYCHLRYIHPSDDLMDAAATSVEAAYKADAQ